MPRKPQGYGVARAEKRRLVRCSIAARIADKLDVRRFLASSIHWGKESCSLEYEFGNVPVELPHDSDIDEALRLWPTRNYCLISSVLALVRGA